MDLSYENIESFITEVADDKYYLAECECGGLYEMDLEDSYIAIGNNKINIIDCPVLVCQKCGKKKLGNLIPEKVIETAKRLDETGYVECRLTALGQGSLDYAKGAGFIYDMRDLNIPGVSWSEDDPTKQGFSCPVYFERKVLNAFNADADYGLELGGESLGSLGKKGTDGWEWEWNIPFGINQLGHVIFFLGDLEQLIDDERTLLLLRSYNIVSDHKLVGTELYETQMRTRFTQPIKEKRIIGLRNRFYKNVEQNYGLTLFHLEDEVQEKAKRIKKPINYSEKEVGDSIVLLDAALNEGVDGSALKELFKKIVKNLPKNFDDLKTRKLLQGILEELLSSADKAKTLISPLFVLNDLRVVFAHLLAGKDVEKFKANAVQCLEISDFNDYESLYETLLDKLLVLYQFLAKETI